MSARIMIKLGNTFEGGMDLSVLPCSSKGTFKSARPWVELYGLAAPNDIPGKLELGGLTRLRTFPKDKKVTRYYAWAAAVFNDWSSFETVEEIGKKLGEVTQRKEKIRNVETPLLGTGYGRLPSEDSAKALTKGFAQTAHEDACLSIFTWDNDRFTALSDEFSKSTWSKALDAVSVSPGAFGFNVDLIKLARLLK